MYVNKFFVWNHVLPVPEGASDGADGVDQNEVEKDREDGIHKDVHEHILAAIVELAIVCQHQRLEKQPVIHDQPA